jgi:tetratricopeptide (TPR) repeat protein
MTSRPAIRWSLIVAILAGTLIGFCWSRFRVPKLPEQKTYSNLPASFTAELDKTEAEVRSSHYAPEQLRKLERLYQANGLNQEARVCFGVIGPRDHLTAQDHYLLSDLDLQEGNLDAAIRELTDVTTEAPTYVPAALTFGNVLFKSGNIERAGAVYQSILSREADQPQAMYGLARIELQQGQDDAAVRRLERVLHVHPEMTSAAGLLAQIFERKGDPAHATLLRTWSRQKPEPVPTDPWLDQLLVDCFDLQRLGLKFEAYFTAGEIDRAVPLLQRIELLDPTSSIPPLLRGWTYARDKQYPEAVVQYKMAIERGADVEKICPYLLQALLASNRLDEAEKLVASFHQQKPDSTTILTSYAEIAMKRGEKPLARQLLQQVIEREPNSVSANMSLAMILWSEGDHATAAQCLERIVAVSVSDVAARGLLAQYFLEIGKPELAIKPLNEALAVETRAKEKGSLSQMLYTAYLGAGDRQADGGLPTEGYDNAIKLEPENPDAYARKAQANARIGNFGAAESALRELSRLQPKNPTIILSLGDILFQEGDKTKAMEAWKMALNLLHSEDTELRTALNERLSGHGPS